jgi:small subunit ribosomal protein S2
MLCFPKTIIMDTTFLTGELTARGAHIGYSRSRRHPSVLPFLYGMKNRIDIIDLEESSRILLDAKNFLSGIKAAGKPILVVGTKAEARDLVSRLAERYNQPFIEQRWIGGTLTNTSEIGKRVSTLATLKEQQATNTLVYRTKKERLMLERKIEKMEIMFGGIQNLKGMPGAILVVDPRAEDNCIKEAIIKKIPVIALANTDCNIADIDYPIVANDSSLATISFVLEYLLG